jgi:hypothetical protein
MKKFVVVAIYVIALMSSCIGQEWTVEEWRTHLTFVNPSTEQNSTGMLTGFENIEELPAGTHMAFKIDADTTFEGTDVPFTLTLGFTVTGKEAREGVDYTVVDVTMNMEVEMEMEGSDSTLTMTFEGKEWVDTTGSPVTMEGTATGKIGEFEMPISFAMERIGEEQYHGHDCWIYEVTQSMEMEGFPTGEIKAVQYMDKKSYAVVRTIAEFMGEETDSGYTEPVFSYGELQWELGARETITTDMGTYDCQIIYLLDDGETVGTIWANEDVRAPIKYEISFKQEDMEFTMIMTLIEYTLG